MNYTLIAIAIAAAVVFYKAGEMENRSPLPWVALSILVSAIVITWSGSTFWMVVGQVALFPLIAIWRVWREGDKDE